MADSCLSWVFCCPCSCLLFLNYKHRFAFCSLCFCVTRLCSFSMASHGIRRSRIRGNQRSFENSCRRLFIQRLLPFCRAHSRTRRSSGVSARSRWKPSPDTPPKSPRSMPCTPRRFKPFIASVRRSSGGLVIWNQHCSFSLNTSSKICLKDSSTCVLFTPLCFLACCTPAMSP